MYNAPRQEIELQVENNLMDLEDHLLAEFVDPLEILA